MRTKTLLLTAVLGSACVATSLAQSVFSVNAVGYINLELPAGFSMIANQLNNPAGNTLNDLLPDVALGATIFKWDETTGGFVSAINFGTWDPNFTMNPGEGGFINLENPESVTLIGEVPQGELSTEIPAGLSIRSSVVPQSGELVSLGFPAELGDTIFRWTGSNYESAIFFGGTEFNPPLVPEVGEAFFVSKETAGTWNRTFSVND